MEPKQKCPNITCFCTGFCKRTKSEQEQHDHFFKLAEQIMQAELDCGHGKHYDADGYCDNPARGY